MTLLATQSLRGTTHSLTLHGKTLCVSGRCIAFVSGLPGRSDQRYSQMLPTKRGDIVSRSIVEWDEGPTNLPQGDRGLRGVGQQRV